MKNIIFLGDSLTFGYGLNRNLSFASLIEKNIDYPLINKGINGSTTTDMLVRFTKDVIDNNPYLLLILGGTNDILSNKPLKLIIENISLMVEEALSNNVKVILASPPSFFKDSNSLFINPKDYDKNINKLSLLNSELSSLATLKNINFIDLFSITNSLDNIFIDGVHLNEEGNRLLYNKILLEVKKELS